MSCFIEEPEQPDLLEFHRFISGTLVPVLNDLERQHKHAAETAVSCNALAQLIDDHLAATPAGDGRQPLEAIVDFGERCIVQAVIPDPTKLLVDTGVLGLRVEMGLAEARKFAILRAAVLEGKCDSLGRRIDAVSEDIAEARGLLDQLHALPNR